MILSGTIGMQDIRHLNLFRKVTGISTRHVFNYNNMLVFCVPKMFLYQAIGKDAGNLKQISKITGKRIKVIPVPKGEHHAKDFIRAIVSPVEFNDIEIKDNEIILTAGSRNKAALLGRDKRRLHEMQLIIKNFFGKEFKIV